MAVDVSIVSCKSYDAEECRLALEQALAPFGGLDWVKDGMRVVIKVNLVSAMKPEQAALRSKAGQFAPIPRCTRQESVGVISSPISVVQKI